MIRRIARDSLFALLVLAAVFIREANAISQELPSQYVRERWGDDGGLHGEVYSITQTGDGYLWIGTEKGLFRFDGSKFFPMTAQGPAAVPIIQVPGLLVDGQGNLVVRLPERNLLRYANGAFENTLSSLQPRELAITAMAQANDRALLVSGLSNGTLRYSGGRFETLVPVTALPASPIISLAQSTDGRIWMGTRDAGLFYAEQGRVTRVTKGLPGRRINSLLAVGTDVWIGTDAGVARWNGTEVTADGVPLLLRRSPALAMMRDRHSNLWIGATSGLLRMNPQGVASLQGRESNAGAPVNAVFEDREGNLWSGGPWGIERLSDGGFTTYGRAEGLPSDRNGAIFADSEGRTWFAPIEGGLYWLKEEQRERVTEAGLGSDIVYSIGGGKDGLWVGRQRGGLTHLYSQGGKLTAENFTQAQGLAQNSVYSIYQSRDGTVWAGTLSRGVSKLQGGRITTYSAADGLASNTVNSILESSDGTMWFATPDGLRSLSNGRWRKYDVRDGLPSDAVTCLSEDSRGVLWIGTSGGLAFFSGGVIQTPRRTSELLHGQIFGVVEDRTGWLWVVTSEQVVHVNRDRLLLGALTDGDLREYGVDDGLRSVEGIRRDRSVVVDPQGRIWISMTNGLSVTDPAQLADRTVPAIVHILSISADSRPIDVHSASKVPSPPGRLTFVYSGLSLRNPDRVRFRYQLDGYDSRWSEVTAAHEATYTNIGPGSYRFRVIASNADGVWNPEETVVGLEIAPFFWQTWWFRLSVVSTFGLGMLALYRLRLHQVRTHLNRIFEERLAERTQIAQELHDTLLQGFLSASMQLHVVADRLPEDSPAKQPLSGVLELMRRVIDEGRNTVRGMRSSPDAARDLQQAFSQIRDELDLPDDVGFRVIVGGQARPLHPILRDEVYRIGREALVNAVQHSGAKNIEVELEYKHKELRLLVRDSGSGIDPQVMRSDRGGHSGLEGMRERAERIGGRLHVYSSATAGTEVELTVPSRVAFEPKSPNVFQRWFMRKSAVNGSKK